MSATLDEFSEQWLPDSAGNREIFPGEGVFVFVALPPGQEPHLVTFAGEVPQGELVKEIPAGLSICSSIAPLEATLDELGFPAEVGDQVFQFDPVSQSYYGSTFDEFTQSWLPPLKKLKIGEAFWVNKVAPAAWIQTYIVEE